jgi:hypothetical protein
MTIILIFNGFIVNNDAVCMSELLRILYILYQQSEILLTQMLYARLIAQEYVTDLSIQVATFPLLN